MELSSIAKSENVQNNSNHNYKKAQYLPLMTIFCYMSISDKLIVAGIITFYLNSAAKHTHRVFPKKVT